MDVIDRIEKLLAHRGVPPRGMKRALSDACGISYEAVRQWFSGSTANIKHDNLVAISREWQGSISWLLTGEGPMTLEEYRQNAIATSEGQPLLSLEQTVKEPAASYTAALDYNLLEGCIEDIETVILMAKPLSPKLKSRAITALYRHRAENGMKAMPNDVNLAISIIASLDA